MRPQHGRWYRSELGIVLILVRLFSALSLKHLRLFCDVTPRLSNRWQNTPTSLRRIINELVSVSSQCDGSIS